LRTHLKITYTVSGSRENEANVEKELTVMDSVHQSARVRIRSSVHRNIKGEIPFRS
jgi:hypothetical protein